MLFLLHVLTDGKGNVNFDIILHYNGEFDECGYHEGDVVVEEFEVDRISLVSIDVWVDSLGFMGEFQYYWKMPGLNFKSSLKILENDASVTEMALYAADEGIVDVYVKHLTFEELEELVNPRRQSGVVIEEIVDSS